MLSHRFHGHFSSLIAYFVLIKIYALGRPINLQFCSLGLKWASPNSFRFNSPNARNSLLWNLTAIFSICLQYITFAIEMTDPKVRTSSLCIQCWTHGKQNLCLHEWMAADELVRVMLCIITVLCWLFSSFWK